MSSRLKNEGVGPVRAKKKRILGGRDLLFLRVSSDVPKQRSQGGSVWAGPFGEPPAPILAREARLVQMILQPEGHLVLVRIGQPGGQVVLKVSGGARVQSGGRRGRKASGPNAVQVNHELLAARYPPLGENYVRDITRPRRALELALQAERRLARVPRRHREPR